MGTQNQKLQYRQARGRFLAVTREGGWTVEVFEHPSRALDGGPLCVDVAWRIPHRARTCLVVISGTHGVEGLAGSACQAALLDRNSGWAPPPGVGLALIHALNPYGFDRTHRTDEGNVDLNRNFVDFSRPTPRNADYGLLHEALCPAEWSEEAVAQGDAALAQFFAKCGARRAQRALAWGQYTHPNGLFYGGDRPSWSNSVLRQILERLALRAQQLVGLDIHTGLGEPGRGELIANCEPADARLQAARHVFGEELRNSGDDSAVATMSSGLLANAFAQLHTPAPSFAVTLEYGVRPLPATLGALRADNWRRHASGISAATQETLRRRLEDAFYLDESEWEQAVLSRCVSVVQASLARLSS